MSTLDTLIAQAIEQHKAIEDEKQRQQDEERRRIIDAEMARVASEFERKLSPAVRAALRIAYDYGHVQGYHRDGFACAYALLSVDDARLTLLIDGQSHPTEDHYQRWVLITPEYARLGLKAFDAETAERNLLLAIHDWQKGDHLHED